MTALQQLVEDRLGTDLNTYLKSCRKQGMGVRKIATDIYERTGVSVSKSALAEW